MVTKAFSLILVMTYCFLCGLMMTLTLLLDRHWKELDEDVAKESLRTFLRVAKGHWVITGIVIYAITAPILLGVPKIQVLDGKLLLAAAVVFASGFVWVTMKLNFPVYGLVMASSNDELSNWDDILHRFYVLNLVRFTASFLAAALVGSSLLV